MLSLFCEGIAGFYAGICMLAGISPVKGTGTAAAIAVEAVVQQSEAFQGAKALWVKGLLYILIPLLLAILIIFISRIYPPVLQGFSRVKAALTAFLSIIGVIKGKDADSLDESLDITGYSYDPEQDIFYSIINPWQRQYGYCRLYDEAAAPFGIIVDCEPVYFEYCGEKWMIEFWKGQYDLTTGCEIGVYKSKGPDLNIPGIFNGTFYDCVSDAEFLHMSFTLKKNGKTLFSRKDRHWWLTGFKLGEFSEPSELTMDISITFKDRIMLNAFVEGLIKEGYLYHEVKEYGDTACFIFGETRTPQPLTRVKAIEWIIQIKNKLLCDKYKDITEGRTDIQDKIKAMREQAPDTFGAIMNIGKPKQLYDMYEVIKKYLNK